MATATVDSIMLQLGLTGMFEGGRMPRPAAAVVADVQDACRRLEAGETVYLSLAGDNLVRVRTHMDVLYAGEMSDD